MWASIGAIALAAVLPGCGDIGRGDDLILSIGGCPGEAVIAGNDFTLTASVLDADGNDVSNTATYVVEIFGATFEVIAVTTNNQIEITVPVDAQAGNATFRITASLGELESNSDDCVVAIEANPCGAEGDPCDDQDPCTDNDACTADFECVGTPADCDDGNPCTDDSCNPADGMCDNIPNTDSCDDGDDCTENDACADGACAGDDVECPAGQECDGGQCVTLCDDDAQCDDSDACTQDACVDGLCDNSAPTDCDDGDACTDDSCDSDAGCSNTPVVCDAGLACDPDTGECVDAACEEDADCDDGVFCNGQESCADGTCVAGSDPCADTICVGDEEPFCDEGDNAAVCSCPTVDGLDFTLGQDNITGSTNDDLFFAPLNFNAATGTQLATLQTADFANGLAGDDMCQASFVGGEAPLPNLQGIEHYELSNFGANPAANGTSVAGSLLTMNAANIAGAESFLSVNSTSDIVVTGLNDLVDFGMRNVQNAAVDMAIEFATAAVTSGGDDEISFSVGSTVGDAVVGVPAGVVNGIERLMVLSEGNGELNTVTTFRHVQNDGTPNTYLDNPLATSLTEMHFSGTSPLNTQVLPNSALTLDGSGMAASWTLGSGDGSAANPYAGFHAANQNINAITGGNGDDLFIFAGQLTDADANDIDQFIDGGPGIDAVQATLAANIAAIAPFLSVEQLLLNATGGNRSINLTGVTGIESVTIDGAAGGAQADQITLLNISGSPLPAVSYRGDGAQAGQGYDPLNYTATGVGGAGDALEMSIGNRGVALNQNGTANNHALGAITVPNIEQLSLDVQDGPAALNGITASTLSSLSASSVSNLTLGAIGTGGGDTITSLSFGGVLGNLSGTFNNAANGLSLSSGPGNDNCVVANSAAMVSSVMNTGEGDDTLVSQDADSQDVISTGAGADNITAGGGNDVITPGDGNDVVAYTSLINAGGTNSDGADQISGFAVGDLLRFSSAPPALQTGGAGVDNATVIGNNGIDTTVIVDLDTGVGTNFLTITLTGVQLNAGNFAIQNTTDVARTN